MAARQTVYGAKSTFTLPGIFDSFASPNPVVFSKEFKLTVIDFHRQLLILNEVELVLRVDLQVEVLDSLSNILVVDLPVQSLHQLLDQILINILGSF